MCRTQAGRLCPFLFLSKRTALGRLAKYRQDRTQKEGGMAVSAVRRLAFFYNEPVEITESCVARRPPAWRILRLGKRDARSPFQKSKGMLLLV